MNTTTDTPETDAACGTGNWIHCVDADFARALERRAIAAEARVKELEAALRLRLIAEAGPVPEGAVRLWSYWQEGFQRWNIKDIPVNGPTHFIDIYPPQQ